MTSQVEVYYNNHKKCFSVKRANGNLLFHATGVILATPKLKVNWKGAQRVLRLGRKEVFAKIRGEYWASSDQGRGPNVTDLMGRFHRYFTKSEHEARVVTARVCPRKGIYDTLTDYPLTESKVTPMWALLYLDKDTGSPRILLDYDERAGALYEDQKKYLGLLGLSIECKDVWDRSDYLYHQSIRDTSDRNRERVKRLEAEH